MAVDIEQQWATSKCVYTIAKICLVFDLTKRQRRIMHTYELPHSVSPPSLAYTHYAVVYFSHISHSIKSTWTRIDPANNRKRKITIITGHTILGMVWIELVGTIRIKWNLHSRSPQKWNHQQSNDVNEQWDGQGHRAYISRPKLGQGKNFAAKAINCRVPRQNAKYIVWDCVCGCADDCEHEIIFVLVRAKEVHKSVSNVYSVPISFLFRFFRAILTRTNWMDRRICMSAMRSHHMIYIKIKLLLSLNIFVSRFSRRARTAARRTRANE